MPDKKVMDDIQNTSEKTNRAERVKETSNNLSSSLKVLKMFCSLISGNRQEIRKFQLYWKQKITGRQSVIDVFKFIVELKRRYDNQLALKIYKNMKEGFMR